MIEACKPPLLQVTTLMNKVKKSPGYLPGKTVSEKSRGYSVNTKFLMIIRKDTSVGRQLLHCLMARRPNKSQWMDRV